MLDPRTVAQDTDRVRRNLQRRHADDAAFTTLDSLTAAIQRRKELQAETDQLRAQRNAMSKQIGPLMKSGRRDEAAPLRDQVKQVSARLEILDHERKELEEQQHHLLHVLPNLLADGVPDGKSEEDNLELRRVGTPGTYDFEVRDHVDLGEALGIFDFGRAAKLSGARFPVCRGLGARLERALINLFLDRAGDNGYVEHVVPYIVSRGTMTGTGQLPKFEHDLFRLAAQVNGEDAFLIPTAEVPLTNLHAGEILSADQLPLSYCAFTPCFRSEAGSYGRDVRGLIRQHQFHKVELVKICTPEQAEAALERLIDDAEGLLRDLELPYRVEKLCAGDTSATAAVTYDLEVWLPSQERYREISSCSWFGDFQARRMGCRHRPEGGGKPRFCHTINGSGLAVGRTVVALLENHQQADGSVHIPAVLQPYMGGLDRISGAD